MPNCVVGEAISELRKIRRCQGRNQGEKVIVEQTARAKAPRSQRVVQPSTEEKVNTAERS